MFELSQVEIETYIEAYLAARKAEGKSPLQPSGWHALTQAVLATPPRLTPIEKQAMLRDMRRDLARRAANW